METGEKMKQIRKAFEEFANAHRNDKRLFKAKEINDSVQAALDFKLNMCAADFAEPECSKPRAKNEELFVRQKKGYYLIKNK